MDAPDRRRGVIIDVVGVAVVVLLVLVGSRHVEPAAAERSVDTAGYVWGVAGGLALLLWRRRPLVMVVAVAVAIFGYLAAGYPPGPALLSGPISVVLLGLQAPRRVAWGGATLMAAAVFAGQLVGEGRGQGVSLGAAGWSLAAVLAGQLLGARRDRAATEREQRRLAERQALTDERLRIARDLHDSVAHAMATINVQAGAAGHLLATRPERVDARQVGAALDAIRVASGEVLDELGAILGLLRRDPGADRPDDSLQPQLGLDRLSDLVGRARLDGLDVVVDIDDATLAAVDQLGASTRTTAYRVVQEALSNVRQHAGPGARTRVTVAIGSGTQLTITVADDGGLVRTPGAALHGRDGSTSSPGFGLVGMRERVESTGGSLDSGPEGDGGFRVEATWPAR